MFSRLLVIAVLAALAFFSLSPSWAQTISAEWTKKKNADWYPAGPGQRLWSKLFFDSAAQRIAVLGGASDAGYRMDIWHYNVGSDTWVPYLLPAIDCPGYAGFSGPDGRDSHSAEYDPINDGYWSVAGGGYKCGRDGEGPPVARTAAAGTTTSTIIDPSLAATDVDFYKDWSVFVGNKQVFVTAYDPVAKKLTLGTPITGLSAGSVYTIHVWTDGQTWFYSKNSGTWTGFEGPHWGSVRPSPVDGVLKRQSPGFAYSTRDNVFVYHGGSQNGQGMNDTWVLDPVTMRYTLKQANSLTGFPYGLMELTTNFVYDEANDVFILFGGRCADTKGRCANGSATGETWAYRLSTNTWTKKTPAVSPPARETGAMYYDSRLGKVVLFGGSTADVYNLPPAASFLNDLWVYDYPSNTWTRLTTAVTPAPRYLHMMAYDPIARKGVMYGGRASGVPPWEIWTLELTQASTPPVAVAAVTPGTGTTATDFAFSSAGSADDDGDDPITAFSWDFGDGSGAAGINATHRYASAGNYLARLTVTSRSRATVSATVPVTVSPAAPANLPPIALATVDQSAGTTATVFAFNGATSSDPDGTIVSYAWIFGDGAVAAGVTATHQYATAANFTARLTVTDNAGATAFVDVPVAVSAVVPAPSIVFQRTLAGTVSNGAVTQVLVGGLAVPFSVSGSSFTATISAATAGPVSVTIQTSGPGGTASQVAVVSVP